MTDSIEYRTSDHPEALGRRAREGETEYKIQLPLEDGRTLILKLGQPGFELLTQFLVDMLTGTPSYGDGQMGRT